MAGYIICDDTAIWAVGDTEDAAWADWKREMEMGGHLTVVEIGAPEDGSDGYVTDENFRIHEATDALIARVLERGGNTAWTMERGDIADVVS